MIDVVYSFTLLSTYKKCRRRAYLQYIKKVVPRDKIDSRPFIVGIVADWLFNRWVEEGFPSGWMCQKSDELFDWFANRRFIKYRGEKDKEGLKWKLKASVQALESASFAENLSERALVVQKRIEKVINGRKFKGKLDLWFPEEKSIWDLKITKTYRYLEDFQLYFYSWLMKQVGESVDSVSFFSPLMSPYLRSVEYNIEIMADFEKELNELLALIEADHWEGDAKDCWNCPVAFFCEEPIELKKFKKLSTGGFKIDL